MKTSLMLVRMAVETRARVTRNHAAGAAPARDHETMPSGAPLRWTLRRKLRAAIGRVAVTDAGVQIEARDLVALSQLRTMWRYGLGGLWILDALLQAQPSMFSTAGMVGNVLLPAAQGQPGWIAGPMTWGAALWAAHAAIWNSAAVALELLLGCLILIGRRWPTGGRAGLALSIAWALVVWYFGEGLGGIFSGSATYVAGSPGSAFLYALLACALLLPDGWWSSPWLLRAFQIAVGALWALGAVFQMAPLYWSPLGLASALQNVAMMPLPLGLGALDAQLLTSMATAPALWNATLCAVMLGLAAALLVGRGGKTPYIIAGVWLAIVWLVFLWVVFQGIGMVFSGMATDPNTPPLWALLLLPGWFVRQAHVVDSEPAICLNRVEDAGYEAATRQ